ncbi:hypothetical protein SBA2_20010 [Acidobacteriia bacterium SbA2]|nr:hypothetical protein SBA2_20010 [Acidobacteriia bacterium SbA2]
MQDAAPLVSPIGRHVLARIAEGKGPFHPNLLVFQRALVVARDKLKEFIAKSFKIEDII